MSTETPETPVASTPPTPENVAEMLTSSDNDYHDGNYWHPSIGAQGNVVHIGITAYSEDGEKLPEQHFRAVVVEGETVPDLEALGELAAEVDRLRRGMRDLYARWIQRAHDNGDFYNRTGAKYENGKAVAFDAAAEEIRALIGEEAVKAAAEASQAVQERQP